MYYNAIFTHSRNTHAEQLLTVYYSTQGSTAVTTRRGQSVCGDYFAGVKKVLQHRELRSMLQDFTSS